MINIEILLIHLLVIIHIFVWLYVCFGGIISEKQNNFILYIGLPLIYIIHLLPFHILSISKDIIAKNITNNTKSESSELIANISDIYIFPNFFGYLRSLFDSSYQNPFSTQGLIIFAFIINVYLHKYKYHQ
jgi:hypothetical protein